MSCEGYNSPSATNEVFLGFNWTSADFSRHDASMISGVDYGTFADTFYIQLLQYDRSVHDALDLASQAVFAANPPNTITFWNSPAHTGFIGDQGQYGALQIFGNGNRGLP